MAKSKKELKKKNDEEILVKVSQAKSPHKPLPRTFAYILLVLGCIFLLFALFFTIRTVLFFMHPPHPITRETNSDLIQDWMTLPYISRAYQIPEPKLREALNLGENPNRSDSISKISQKNNLQVSELLNLIRQTIVDYQKEHSPRPVRPPLP